VASMWGYTATVQALIGAGADLNVQPKVRDVVTYASFLVSCSICYGCYAVRMP
jgi:hypothetical protein